jgi:hypothetical protein
MGFLVPLAAAATNVAAGVKIVADTTAAIQQVVNTFNTERSVVLTVANFTGFQLNRITDDHAHGGFAVTPTAQIPPQHADIFGAQKKGGALFTGTNV